MTTPLPLPFLLPLQVIIGEVEVRQCAAHYLMLPGRRRVVPPKLQDMDSCAQLVQHGPGMLSTLILAAYNVLYAYSTLYVALYAVCTLLSRELATY
jgi:hypothetical protein